MNPVLQAALEFIDQDICVIPVRPREKSPLIAWKEFQSRLPTEDEVYNWFENHPERNIGIVCGAISGDLVIADIDGPEGLTWVKSHLPGSSIYVKTPKNEFTYHCYYRGKGIRNGKPHPEVDIRGEGGFVVAPPSTHPNGGKYELIILEGANWKDLPPFQMTTVGLDLSTVKTSPVMEPKPEGSRNQSLAALVGRWCSLGLDITEIFTLARQWNLGNTPPLDDKEFRQTVESIINTHNRNHPGLMVSQGEPDLPEVDLDDGTGNAFPEELLNPGGILQKIMDYTEKSNAASIPMFALAGAIATMGAVCGYRIQGETQLKTNFYIISSGSSGTGKNAACSSIPSLLLHAARPAHGPTDMASAASIYSHLKSPENRVALICVDEIGMLLKGLRYPESPKAEIPQLLTKLFSSTNRPLIKSYADSKLNLSIPYHCLSLYGASTNEELWKGISFDDAANGFLARILLFDYKGKAPRPKENIDTTVPKDLAEDLAAIWNIKTPKTEDNIDPIPIPFTIPIAQDARWIWKPWTDKWFDLKTEFANDPARSSIYNRAVEHAWKLAIIHAASLHGANIINGGTIGVESIQWATALSDFLTHDMAENIAERVTHNDWHANQKRILSIIKRLASPARPGATIRELTKYAHMPSRILDEILANLEKAGKIHRRSSKPERGREVTIFCISKEAKK